MKVVFVQDVPNVAEVGDIKEVKKGHARNYLLPKGLAVLATENELRRIESRKRAAAILREEQKAEAMGVAGSIDGIILTFAKRVTSKGNIYGSVSATAIQQELKHLGHTIEKSMIKLEDPIRQLGEHEVEVELNKDAIGKIKIIIEPAEGEKDEEKGAEKAEESTEETPVEDQPAQALEDNIEESSVPDEEEPVETVGKEPEASVEEAEEIITEEQPDEPADEDK